MTIHAAGCVVYRPDPQHPGDGEIELLLVHRNRYDDWTFPKGKREPGETDLACALRETEEECGHTGEVGPELPSIEYQAGGRPKVVRYWLLASTGGSFEPNEEVDEVRWVPLAEAAKLLTYHHDRDVLAEVPRLVAGG